MHVDQIGWIATSSLGLFGVLLFFVHTSLVLTQSMERGGLSGWPFFRDFYIRRFFRIYPLAIVAVVAALVLRLDSDVNGVAGLSHAISPPGKLTIVSHLLLIQNLFHIKSIVNVLWSLPFEVEMYVLLPMLFVFICSRRRVRLLLALWLVSLGLAVVQPHVALFSRLSILVFAPNFLAGLIAFVVPRIRRFNALFWPVVILGSALVFTIKPMRYTGWILCLLLGFLIPQFNELNSPWLRMFSNRIATYSYGIYLSHQFSIWFTFDILRWQPAYVKVPILAALLILLPVVLYHCIEKPLIGVGVRLATAVNQEPAFERHAVAAAA